MASTSWPDHSDINVYRSTDGGQTFTSGVDATPDALAASRSGATKALTDMPAPATEFD